MWCHSRARKPTKVQVQTGGSRGSAQQGPASSSTRSAGPGSAQPGRDAAKQRLVFWCNAHKRVTPAAGNWCVAGGTIRNKCL